MRVNSESEELAQGIADLFLPVLSPLDVDESFSFYPRTVGSRAPRLQPGRVCAGKCLPGHKLLKPALVCACIAP